MKGGTRATENSTSEQDILINVRLTIRHSVLQP